MTEFINYPFFIDNKYYKCYVNLITKYSKNIISDGYTENHHILPKSLSGSNDVGNIITIPARVHYILHHLLIKFTQSNDKAKMCFALHCFFHLKSRYRKLPTFKSTSSSSKIYQLCKEEISNYKKGNSNYYKKEIYTVKDKTSSKTFTGTRKELRDLTGLTHQELYNLISLRNKCLKGWGVLMDDNSYSFDKARKPIETTYKVCPHCNISVDMRNYGKWHGQNCKTINPEKYRESLDSSMSNLSKAWEKK